MLRCSKDHPDTKLENFFSVYMANIPVETTVKKLMGTIRSVIGDFTAMNKLRIEGGQSKVSFDNVKHQEALLANGLTGSLTHVILSKHPLRIPHNRSHSNHAGFAGGSSAVWG